MENTEYTYNFLKSIVKDIKPNYAITKSGGGTDIDYINSYFSSNNIPTSYNCLDSFLEQMFINLGFGHSGWEYKVYAIVSNWNIFIYNDNSNMTDSISCEVIFIKNVDSKSSEDITVNFDIHIPKKEDRNKLTSKSIITSRELLIQVINNKVNMMKRNLIIDKILNT